jgi:hypothetical protein
MYSRSAVTDIWLNPTCEAPIYNVSEHDMQDIQRSFQAPSIAPQQLIAKGQLFQKCGPAAVRVP